VRPPPCDSSSSYGESACALLVVPLTPSQLQHIHAILPEVRRLTGAQAALAAPGSNVADGVQLCLSGSAAQMTTAHALTSILLAQVGVTDPLSPARTLCSPAV
jgi:hypothetical protein